MPTYSSQKMSLQDAKFPTRPTHLPPRDIDSLNKVRCKLVDLAGGRGIRAGISES